MKSVRYVAAVCSLAVLLAAVASGYGQAEKIKQKAKDLKKQVETGQTTTNKPPQKTPPPPPPPSQKPAR